MISAVIGLQYGDEGKGKFVDYLAKDYDVSIRFNGSNNAGHSVSVGDKNYAVHLVPSGIFHDKYCLVANQCVLDPIEFCKQLDYVSQNGFNQNKIKIGSRVSLICPFHRHIDNFFQETSQQKLGTTRRGVGPAYADKMNRTALRMQDAFLDKNQLLRKYQICFNRNSQHIFKKDIKDDQFESFYSSLQRLKKHIVDVTDYMLSFKNKNILFEGAQSTQLDLTWGEYPFVTSSSCLAQNAMLSVGMRFQFDKVYGVFKAYTTRVGTGPFVTQMEEQIDNKVRTIGKQYGVTTGRPRKCGWLDLVSLKRSCVLNGVTDLCIVKGDVFNGFKYVNVCNAYYKNQEKLERYPFTSQFKDIQPIYSTFPGWENTNESNFKNLINFIQSYIGTHIKYISFSPRRQDVIENV